MGTYDEDIQSKVLWPLQHQVFQSKQPGSERDDKRQYTTYEVSKARSKQVHQIQVYALVMSPPSLSYQTKQPDSERDNKRQYTTYEVSKSHQLPETSCIQWF
jgi:hypothetical protein